MLKKLRERLQWFDPFFYVDKFVLPKINPGENEVIKWVVYLISAFVFAWIIYTAFAFALSTPNPMVIVVSPSMEPLFFRGDVIVLQGTNADGLDAPQVFLLKESLANTAFEEIAVPAYTRNNGRVEIKSIKFNNGEEIEIKKNGSIVVYFSEFRQQPIIHRVVAKLHASDGWYVLTKGDSINNNTIDQDCGRIINGVPEKQCINLYPVPVSELQGKAIAKIPFIGCVKLWLFDNIASLIATGRMPANFKGYC